MRTTRTGRSVSAWHNNVRTGEKGEDAPHRCKAGGHTIRAPCYALNGNSALCAQCVPNMLVLRIPLWKAISSQTCATFTGHPYDPRQCPAHRVVGEYDQLLAMWAASMSLYSIHFKSCYLATSNAHSDK